MTKKSGKGNASGVVSELSLYWTVMPGHEQALRAAIDRFVDRVGSRKRYVNALGQYTMPEVVKAARVNQAFQQVLDDPAGSAALIASPALKPLVDQADV